MKIKISVCLILIMVLLIPMAIAKIERGEATSALVGEPATPFFSPRTSSQDYRCSSAAKCEEVDQSWMRFRGELSLTGAAATMIWDPNDGWIEYVPPQIELTPEEINPEQYSSNYFSDCPLTPIGRDSQSIGNTNRGSQTNSVQLRGSTYIDQSRDNLRHAYGTQELVNLLELAACHMGNEYGSQLTVHDLSLVSGGEFNPPHVSHQSGLDADLGYYTYEHGNYGNSFTDMCDLDSNNARRCLNFRSKFNNSQALRANWEFIKILQDLYDLKFIFVNGAIYDLIKNYATQNHPGEWAQYGGVLSIAAHHHDHYHLRIRCPRGDNQCTDSTSANITLQQMISSRVSSSGSSSSLSSPSSLTTFNGANLFQFKLEGSSCPNLANEMNKEFGGLSQGIVVPQDANRVTDVFYYFHGTNRNCDEDIPECYIRTSPDPLTPLSQCQGKHIEACRLVREHPTSAIILFTRTNSRYEIDPWDLWFKDMSSAGIQCVLDEIRQHLNSLNIPHNADYSLAGLSGGGRPMSEFTRKSPANYFTRNLFFDSCYGNWCETAARSGNVQETYYYVRQGTNTYPLAEAAYSTNSRSRFLTNTRSIGHSATAMECFYDYLLGSNQNSRCNGQAQLVRSSRISTSSAITTQVPSLRTTRTNTPTTCTFEDRIYCSSNRGDICEISYPPDRNTYPLAYDPQGSGCTLCREDQVTITAGGQTFKTCWKYQDQVQWAIDQMVSDGFTVETVQGFREGRTYRENGVRNMAFGQHPYGAAVDINRAWNGLYNDCQTWNPNTCTLGSGVGGEQNRRRETMPQLITEESDAYQRMDQIGWYWGGDWDDKEQKDFMHFSNLEGR